MNLRDFSIRFKKWQDYRRIRNELESLSARELSDIGVARGDIDYIARKSVR